MNKLQINKKIKALVILTVFLLSVMLQSPLAYAADLILTLYNSTYVAGAGSQAVSPDLTITGTGNVTSAKVYFSNFVSGQDSLSYTNVGNISGSYNSSTGILTVSGTDTIANYQTFLRGVKYNTSATSGTKTIYFSVSQTSTDTYYYSGTGHYYEYVATGGKTWEQARDLAAARTYAGLSGYLVTIGDSNENAFVAKYCAGNGWIGASDAASEGVWKWVTDPTSDNNYQFWQGTGSGYAVNGKYDNWASGEPNDASGEDYAHMYSADGTWNDFANTNLGTAGFLVEYGTSYISLDSDSLKSCTVTIVSAPSTPSLTVTPASTSSIQLSWAADRATSYALYRNDSLIYSGTATSYTDTGLSTNTQYNYYVVASNSGGSSSCSKVYKYTYAAIPGITVSNQTPDDSKNTYQVSAGGNPVGTTYLVEYHTDKNAAWTTLYEGTSTDLRTHSALSEDTVYYYRVSAKNGNGDYYGYGTAQVKTNDAPVLSALQPAANIYVSTVNGHTGITLSGTVTDNDNDTVIVVATLNGLERNTTVSNTSGGAAWSLSWDVTGDSLVESTVNGVTITANDQNSKNSSVTNATWSNTIYIDKTNPGAPAISNETAWTNAASVPVEITNGVDTGSAVSGTDHTEYRYKTVSADNPDVTLYDWTSWTVYSSIFNITNAGITTIEAKTYDRSGNVSEVTTATVKIDRTMPAGQSMVLEVDYGEGQTDRVYTRSQTVDLVDIDAGDTGGAASLPTEMQISNNSDFSSSSGWTTYAETYDNWVLSDSNGTKTVYIRFRDAVGNVSSYMSDTIIFDDIPPVIAVSAPSRYAVKKGLSVSYNLTVDDNTATLAGINTGDTAKIALTSSGSIAARNDEMAGWVTVENTDTAYRKVTITLPSTMTEEGTVAIAVCAAAATDPAGNTSLAVPGNFSFNVDSTPPTNQDLLFTSDLTIAGGGSITLAGISADCPGGQEGDSIRFAHVGYDGESPADGATITSTHGLSDTIIAPTTDGIYKLYVVDAAGNISPASIATLTVKNDGPTVTVSGPSDAYVQAENTVSYIVTYSSDAVEITLSPEDVGLIRTGTANAYVSVEEVENEPLKRQVVLSNLMGEAGTVSIRIAAGSACDSIANPSSASAVSEPVTVDNTPPEISSASIAATSNTVDPAFARKGDTITLIFVTDEPVVIANVTILGRSATVSSHEGGTEWSATYNIPEGTTLAEGPATFTIVTADRAGNVSDTVTETSDSSFVTLDFTKPVVTLNGEMDAAQTYYLGDVEITFDEGTAEVENLSAGGSFSISSGDVVSDPGQYRLTVTDAAGNAVQKTFIVSQDYMDVLSDYETLDIIYAPGDSAGFVTRDINLPSSGTNGSNVSWSVTDGTTVTIDDTLGSVERPANGEDDATVRLTAVVEKSGFSKEKVFNLTVIATGGDTDSAKANEDADSAAIIYAPGDSQTYVTQNMELAASGMLHSSAISWVSYSPYVVVNSEAVGGYYTATVTRPEFNLGDITVELTATATCGEATAVKHVTLTIIKGAGTPQQLADADAGGAYIAYQTGESAGSVKNDITLVCGLSEGSLAEWTSSGPEVVTIDGVTGMVTRPTNAAGDQTVEITVTVTNGTALSAQTFTLNVKCLEASPEQDAEDLAQDLDSLTIGYRGSDTASSVTTHLILADEGHYGSAIIWNSDNAAVLSNGTVTRSASGNVNVTLTATLIKGESRATKTFHVTLIQMPLTLLEQLGADADAACPGYDAGDSADKVTGDLTLLTSGANGSTITWTSDNPATISEAGAVTRLAEDKTVTLTAAVAKEGYIIYKNFVVTVKGR